MVAKKDTEQDLKLRPASYISSHGVSGMMRLTAERSAQSQPHLRSHQMENDALMCFHLTHRQRG